MTSLNFTTNRNNLYRVNGILASITPLPTGDIAISPKAGGASFMVSHERFMQDKMNGEIFEVREEVGSKTKQLSPREDQIFNRKLKYVTELNRVRPSDQQFGSEALRNSVIGSIARKIGDLNPPSQITLYRWCKSYSTSGTPELALLPQKRSASAIRDDKPEISIALNVITEYYLTSNCHSVRDSHCRYIEELAKSYGNSVKPIAYNTFRKLIDNQIDPYERIFSRHGSKALKEAKRHIIHEVQTYAPNEAWEADAVDLNIGILDEDGLSYLGKVRLYVVVDRHTKAIMGFHFQLMGNKAGENADSVIDAYRHAVLPKTLPVGVLNNYPMQGLPSNVFADGGPGYRAMSTQEFVRTLGCSSHIVEAGAGYKKGTVERLIGTIRRQFCTSIPGYLREDKKGTHNDGSTLDDTASVTLQELNNLFTKWVVDDYHQKPHLGLNNETPQDVWNAFYSGLNTPLMPENPELLHSFQGSVHEGTIQPTKGIQKNNVFYANDRLMALYAKLHSMPGKNQSVRFEYNSNDISKIVVLDEVSDLNIVQAFDVPATNSTIHAGMSLVEFKNNQPKKRAYIANPNRVRIDEQSADLRRVQDRYDQRQLDKASRKRSQTVSSQELLQSVNDREVTSQVNHQERNNRFNAVESDSSDGFGVIDE